MAFPNTVPLRSSAALAGLALLAGSLAGCSTEPAPAAPGDSAVLVAPPAIIKEGIFTVCVSSDTPPNAFVEEDGSNVGAEVEIAAAVAEEMGLTVEYAEYAFPGRMPALQAKQCDAVMSGLYIKPEREEVVDFVPYLASGSAVAVSRENPSNITGFDDSLCGKKLLAITGATAAAMAEEKTLECVADGLKPIDITYTDQNPNALQQVIAGQVDAYTHSTDIISYYEKLSDGDFKRAGETFGIVNIGAATSKGNDELHNAIETAFAAVIDSGKYADILASWGLDDQNITR